MSSASWHELGVHVFPLATRDLGNGRTIIIRSNAMTQCVKKEEETTINTLAVTHRKLGDGDTDDLCAICKQWCTKRASCSNRYHLAFGVWLNGAPHELEHLKPSEDGAHFVRLPVCDACQSEYAGIDSGETALIAGSWFKIDSLIRAND